MADHIESYVHNGIIGVLVQLECADDITPRTKEFCALARDIAMHIAASKPISISASEIPPDLRNRELEHYRFERYDEEERRIRMEGANSRINRVYSLLEQPFVKKPDFTVSEIIAKVSKDLGDEIRVKRFTRWETDET